MNDSAGPATAMLGRTAGAVVFDWDGTAVADRAHPATAVRERVLRLSSLGVHAAVVSGTHLANVDAQLAARPAGPGRLFLALNRGSELFEVGPGGPVLRHHVPETTEVRLRLDATAQDLAGRLRQAGLEVAVVGHRLNRVKVDLVPEPQWSDPPKARVAELLGAVTARLSSAGLGSLADVADLALRVAADHGLAEARVSSDVKHVEIGITDKSDSMRDVLSELDALGVAGELVLVVGDEFGPLGGLPGSDARLVGGPTTRGAVAVSVGVEPQGVPAGVRHLPGGPRTFLALLDEQVARASALRVPYVCHDPRWTWVEHGVDPARHAVAESLFTLASDGIGWRGSTEETPVFGQPLVTAAGVYAGAAVDDGLLEGPDLADIRLRDPVCRDVRTLDLRTGVLYREEVRAHGPLRSMRFASIVEPAVFALRVETAARRLLEVGQPGEDTSWSAVHAGPGGIGALVREQRARDGDTTSVQRLAAVHADAQRPPSRESARRRLARASAAGFERLLSAQRAAWARRWDRVGVTIPDDPHVELRLRFALFELWNLSVRHRELAVGARSVTGAGYSGHVFWDADAFVLPALVAVDPPSAAAMVGYRLRRLEAARARAAAAGLAGARFPWESAFDGRDVTPTQGFLGGEPVAIRTGELEEHITADVAWAVAHHASWTRRNGSLSRPERTLLRDTARYWASRATRDGDGGAHVLGVIGPDEYHEQVDDNAFTNVMARWNLRYAAQHAVAPAHERAAWAELADDLVDGYDATSRRYEQFRGYFGLERLLVGDVAAPPVAADVLLGGERVAGSQLIKQPDALMIHYLVEEEAAAGSLVPCLDFYGPRTCHGSSLSPAVMAYLHARAGEPDRARELLDLAVSTDPDDIGGTTSAGIHIAACGGAWRAVLGGFLGARVHRGALHLDPLLPTAWSGLEARFRCFGADVRVRAGERCLDVDTTHPLVVRLAPGCEQAAHTSSAVTFERGGDP